MKVIHKIIPRVKTFASGKILFEEIDDVVQEFLFNYQMFSHESDQHKEDRKKILEIQITLAELGKELEKDWNQKRGKKIPLLNDGHNDESTSAAVLAPQTEEFVEQMDENEMIGKRPLDTTDFDTPVAPRKRIKFARVSPKADLLPTFKCHLCPKKYTWLKALRKHVKGQHDGAEVPPNMKEVVDKVTCRICKTKQSRDLITRHIKEVHKYENVDTKAVFRGFLTFDEVKWEPLWLQKNQEDPPTEILAPVDKDGKINLYGFKFKVDEKLIEEGSMDIEPEENTSKDSEDDTVEALKQLDDGTNKLSEEDKSDKETEAGAKIVVTREVFEKGHVDNQLKTDNIVNEPEIEKRDGKSEETGKEPELELCSMEEALAKIFSTTSQDLSEFENKTPGSLNNRRSVVRCLSDEFHPENVEDNYDDGGIGEEEEIIKKDEHKTDLPKVKVQVFNEDVKNGDLWSVEKEEYEFDSDYEDSDREDFTEIRLEMKKIRLERRKASEMQLKLCQLDMNAGIIDEFENYLRLQKFDTSTSDTDLSTVRKMKGHLFNYPDSLLQFQTDAIPDYNLGRHLTPLSEDFLEVSDPTNLNGWIQSIGGPGGKLQPGRRKEMLKSHARWRDFITEKLQATDFGNSAESFYKKEIILKNLEQISTQIKKKNLFAKLSKLEVQERVEKQKAREVVYPSNNFNEQQSVKKWFESEEAKIEEEICLKNYERCLAGVKMGSKEFLRFANWARFTLALVDRNRRSVYNFRNKEFAERVPKWLPGTKNEDDVTADKFELIPEGWNPNVPHSEGEEPTCWVINVCGGSKGLKGGRPAQIVLTPRSAEICLKFRDLKSECLQACKENDPFFVNMKGSPLTAMQRTPGSLLAKLGNVCGLGNATVNTFRRAAEVRVQASPLMKASVENLQSHSRQVGLQSYDRSGDDTRAQFINQLSAMESPNKDESDISDDVKKKRQRLDEEERGKILKLAQQKLIQDKFNKKESPSKKCKLVPEERKFLQIFFTSLNALYLNSLQTFPGKDYC